jgi:uncharacterized protein (TIGR02598 family)
MKRMARARGFSLVEIVIALGVFSFAVIGVFGLISIALNTSKEAQRDSTLASVIRTLDADIRSTTSSAAIAALSTTPRYFDEVGKPLTSSTGAYCKVTLVKGSESNIAGTYGLANASNLHVWSATIAYPAPVYKETTVFLLSSSTYQ